MLIINLGDLGNLGGEEGGCDICRAKHMLREYEQVRERLGEEGIDEQKLEDLVNDLLVQVTDEHRDIATLRKTLDEANVSKYGHVAVMLRLKLLAEVASAAASGLAQLGMESMLKQVEGSIDRAIKNAVGGKDAETGGEPDEYPDWLLEILTSPEHPEDK